MKKIFSIFLAAALLLSMAACGDTQTTTQPQETVDFAQTGMLASGQSVTLTADRLSGQITWTSSNPAHASVDANGTVQAHVGRGTVTVTATAGNQSQVWEIALCDSTAYGNISLPSSQETLNIGVWNGAFQWFDETYTKLMADSGINLVIGVKDGWMWEGDGAPMLDYAQQYGVQHIVDLRNWDGETVPEYADHPALMGFLLRDEPSSPDFETLAQLKKQFELVMPEDLLYYVNLFPESCSYESLFGDDYDSWKVDYEEYYLKKFIQTVDPACLSYDGYPLQEGSTIRACYFHEFEVSGHAAKENGIPFWYTLLASGHSTTDGRYITPTVRELRWQMALGMTYGATTLVHYLLATSEAGSENLLEYGSWAPTPLLDEVKKANQEFRAWEDIYMSYDWLGTAQVDVGMKNPMLMRLEYDLEIGKETLLLENVTTDADLMVGIFQNDSGSAYMVTNAGDASECDKWMQYAFSISDATVELQLADGQYQCAALITDGQITYVPVSESNTVSFTVAAYDSVFVIPVTL